MPDGRLTPNGLLRPLSKNNVKANIRRVLSNVSHSFHRSDSHGMNELLEEPADGNCPHCTGEEEANPQELGRPNWGRIRGVKSIIQSLPVPGSNEFLAPDHSAPDRHYAGRSVSYQSVCSRAPAAKLFTVHEGKEKEGVITIETDVDINVDPPTPNEERQPLIGSWKTSGVKEPEDLVDLIERI